MSSGPEQKVYPSAERNKEFIWQKLRGLLPECAAAAARALAVVRASA